MSTQDRTGLFSRRDFLKGAAATAAVAGGAAFLGGCAATEAANGLPETWDAEADVVIIGYGGAGASAAIGAAQAGSSVIILEKAPEGEEGGNTSVCGGGWIAPNNADGAFTFIKAQCPTTVSDEEIKGFVEELMTTTEWVASIGGTPNALDLRGAVGCLYPGIAGAEAIDAVYNNGGPGAYLFKTLKAAVDGLGGVTVMSATPATHLIFDPVTKEVFGVKASSGGAEINVKAKKGVIMACGGYENNPEMLSNFSAPNFRIYPWGTPYNTGDGVKMVTEIGAKIRHFSAVEWGSFCCKPASEAAGVAVAMVYQSAEFQNAIIVNRSGARFMNEVKRSAGWLPTPTHDKEPLPMMAVSLKTYDYPNGTFYMVYDQARADLSPLFALASKDSGQSWAGIHDKYVWSDDNQAEVEAGYVLKADTIEELAQKAGIDPAALAATVAGWNAACAAGVDAEFGRAEQLSPIATGPFYLTELGMTFINTQGGPDRDGAHRVLDWEGNAIPRLWAAGEFGSIYGWLYQGAGNVPEALGGRVAGANVAAETAWDAEG